MSPGVSTGTLDVFLHATIDGTLVVDVGFETDSLDPHVLTLGSGSTLRVQPIGPLGKVGETTRTIVTVGYGVEGVFRYVPTTGEHLGFGVFAGEASDGGSQVVYTNNLVIYERGRIKIVLYQAAPGDANGDRRFDQRDIISLLNSDKYLQPEPTDWTEGDFTGDGRFDQRDIIATLRSRGW